MSGGSVSIVILGTILASFIRIEQQTIIVDYFSTDIITAVVKFFFVSEFASLTRVFVNINGTIGHRGKFAMIQ